MLDFSTNINSFGPSESVINSLKKNILLVTSYPELDGLNIRSRLASFFEIPLLNLTTGNGSTEIFFNIPRLLQYKRAVILAPTFWEYTVFNQLNCITIKKIFLKENRNFEPDLDEIKKKIRAGDAVFICNVNNPTSTLFQRKNLLSLVKNNPRIHFIIDETYLFFRHDYKLQSVSRYVIKFDNLHVVMSFSKFFNLPGIRLGALISSKKTVLKYNSYLRIPYSTNPLVYHAFNESLGEKSYIIASRDYYDKERIALYKKMNIELKDRLRCYLPAGNFILAKILTRQSSSQITDQLRRMGILIRSGSDLIDMGEDWIRFSLRRKKDNAILLNALNTVLDKSIAVRPRLL